MDTIEMHDIQGFIVRGYKHVPFSRYVLLQVTEAVTAKKWMHDISSKITNATHKPESTCLNIAFTAAGLNALGMYPENLDNFSLEFTEGMVSDHRQRLLGDYGSSSPGHWKWGGNNEPIHILLMVFGATYKQLDQYWGELKNYYGEVSEDVFAPGLKMLYVFESKRHKNHNQEHFGFRDGMSQPVIAGTGREGHPENIVAAGEFIFGYKNEYGVFADSPVITSSQGNTNLLPADAAGSGYKDIGRNGTYLVFRQIEQDVNAFWTFMNEKTKRPDGSIDEQESIKLASKMVGRWPSGAPLVKHPYSDSGKFTDDNDFGYAKHDKDGQRCPFGSHLRRCNPRDAFEGNKQKESAKLTRRHRIIRRGRLYGTAAPGTPSNHTPTEEVGLLFICFNADISRQFEFISYTWANYPNFMQLYNDPDPIIGVREKPRNEIAGNTQTFTIQQERVSRCIQDMKRFITIRGGAYFFFPSLTAVRYLATL